MFGVKAGFGLGLRYRKKRRYTLLLQSPFMYAPGISPSVPFNRYSCRCYCRSHTAAIAWNAIGC
jgi:hypothetical protein